MGETVRNNSVSRRTWRLRTSERRWLLLAGDLIAAALAAFLALQLWSRLDYLGSESLSTFIRLRAPWFPLLPFLWPLLMVELYEVHRAASWRNTFRRLLLAAAAGAVVYLVVYFTAGQGSLPRRGMLYFLALATGLTLVWRLFYIKVFTAPAMLRRVVVAGAGESGRALLQVIQQLQPPPFFVVGVIDDDPSKLGAEVLGVRVVGDNRRLLPLVDELHVTDIIVAITGPLNGEMFQALLDAQEAGVEITRMPVAYEELTGRVPIRHLESDWMLRSFVDEVRVSGPFLVGKWLVDVISGIVGVLIFLFTL
ncbi:MAG TPA: hypothetical protein VK449_07030, partial [Anaerolineales bacterium]|nr:hypothetical protein [Anaerolineales bacterium]